MIFKDTAVFSDLAAPPQDLSCGPSPPPSLLSLVASPSYPSPLHNQSPPQSPVGCEAAKIGAFSFKSYCDKTTGI